MHMCFNREFYYIQMEKYARQALAEGVKNAMDLVVNNDSEIYRILVLHYNRNNQIEVIIKWFSKTMSCHTTVHVEVYIQAYMVEIYVLYMILLSVCLIGFAIMPE